MPINHRLRLIFVHIPKTGGTSIETALGMFHRWQDENTDALFGLIQSPALVAHGWTTQFLQHLSYCELTTLVSPEALSQYLSFSWVRNPWERMVSIYSNTDPNLLQKADRQGLQLRGLSFRDFVAALDGFEHVHLRPQHEFILTPEGKEQVDFIGRFEHFADDFARIIQRLGLNSEIELPHKNGSKHSAYRGFYDDATRRIIEQRYDADIEYFGYTF